MEVRIAEHRAAAMTDAATAGREARAALLAAHAEAGLAEDRHETLVRLGIHMGQGAFPTLPYARLR